MKKLMKIIYYSVLTLIVTSFASMFGNRVWVFLLAWGKARANFDHQMAILDTCGTDAKTTNLFADQCKYARETVRTWPSAVALGSITETGISCGDMPCSALLTAMLNSWVGIAIVVSVMTIVFLLLSRFIEDYRRREIYFPPLHLNDHKYSPYESINMGRSDLPAKVRIHHRDPQPREYDYTY